MIWIIFLHHLADVSLQPTWLIKNKHKHWFSIYEHVFVWTGIISIGLVLFGRFSYYDFVVLFIGHFVIDFIKYRYTKNYNWIYLDQALHYLQIVYTYYN